MKAVPVEQLTDDAFRPFGDVIEAGDESSASIINNGTCLKFAELARPDCGRASGRPAIHIYRAKPRSMPFIVEAMERHRQGSQTFVPLSGNPFLVVVAPAGDLDSDGIRIFAAKGTQGIQFSAGTWHHFCLALGEMSDFLVIDRVAREEDCEEVLLLDDQKVCIEESELAGLLPI